MSPNNKFLIEHFILSLLFIFLIILGDTAEIQEGIFYYGCNLVISKILRI